MLQAYRVWAMQSAIGANAWRTAHNPPSPALLDATDRMGMLVRYTLGMGLHSLWHSSLLLQRLLKLLDASCDL